jgi:hypothetical protein
MISIALSIKHYYQTAKFARYSNLHNIGTRQVGLPHLGTFFYRKPGNCRLRIFNLSSFLLVFIFIPYNSLSPKNLIGFNEVYGFDLMATINLKLVTATKINRRTKMVTQRMQEFPNIQ